MSFSQDLGMEVETGRYCTGGTEGVLHRSTAQVYCTGGTEMPQSHTWQPLSMYRHIEDCTYTVIREIFIVAKIS